MFGFTVKGSKKDNEKEGGGGDESNLNISTTYIFHLMPDPCSDIYFINTLF